ncbi:hypothetical protein [Sphingosinicella sp. BN140058]|uniref:hypothetical protein n=1 Tax=Sphingosinicella sp. BN140058 TaxID=1892855 RepID=UPI0010100C7E|nr:hypothetical protein [Sphingosinicella sp. BN140058]QAY77932.1 hypothetical protein ETR14_16430 [Sphingosinicella sp. BN140058]
MADTIVRIVENETKVIVGGASLLAPYTASASASAIAAAASAAEAELDADRAEIAADAAALNADMYPTTAAGLAATTNGQYFTVPGAGSVYATLYRNDAGAATIVADYPAAASAIYSIGLFTQAWTKALPASVTTVRTTGYSAEGIGAAHYIYDPAVTAAYVTANPRVAFRTVNGRGFRLAIEQRWTIEMFGGRGDLVLLNSDGNFPGDLPPTKTDNKPAFDAYWRYYQFHMESAYRNAAPVLHFGMAGYYFSAKLEPYTMINLQGSGADGSAAAGTLFRWPANSGGGIVINLHDSGDGGKIVWGSRGGSAEGGSPGGGAVGSIIRDIYFVGGGGARDDVSHGIWARATCRVIDCVFDSFEGAGLKVNGTYGGSGAEYGGPNQSYFVRCTFRNNKGLASCWVREADANACTFDSIRIKDAWGIGILEESKFGNVWINPQLDGSGDVRSAAEGRGRVQYGGRAYKLVKSRDKGTIPSSDPNVWVDYGPVSASDPYWPAWSAATDYTSGAGMLIEGSLNTSAVFGGYSENLLVNTVFSGAIMFGGTFTPYNHQNNHFFHGNSEMGKGVFNTNALGVLRNWPSGSPFGAYSYAGLGMIFGGGHPNIFTHYDDVDGKRLCYFRNPQGDYVYQDAEYGSSGNLIRYTTGKNTAVNFGRASPQPWVNFFGKFAMLNPDNPSDTSPKIIGYASAFTNGAQVAKGEIRFNTNPTPGGKVGWVCTTAGIVGSTAVIKAFGSIDP